MKLGRKTIQDATYIAIQIDNKIVVIKNRYGKTGVYEKVQSS